ncbi:MAG TPA: pinensin family lanthipeptide [Longimicrobium sp.]|jgi:hypothetical protein|uniref:pinensin family lanthipeptide n=1 Tax=Longimicrobium sp. TaxID=2029185 RepID=UPI002F1BDE1C
MHKVKLELEQLQVESFATDAAGAARGTVRGLQYTAGYECTEQNYTVGRQCATVQPGVWGCENTGVASCAWCQADSQTCQDCSWTNGDGAMCYW